MVEQPTNRSRHKGQRFQSMLLLVGIVLGYLIVELGYRTHLYIRYAVKADYGGIAIVDTRLPNETNIGARGNFFGPFPPNTDVVMTQYSSDDIPINIHKFHSNNLGWISRFDYMVQKERDEFRIGVVGDSFAASITNSVAWPDVLQDSLNEDRELLENLKVSRITVNNISLSGVNFQGMINPLTTVARRFSPDLLMLNVSTEGLEAAQPQLPFDPLPDEMTASYDTPTATEFPHVYHFDLTLDGVEISLFCSQGERVLSNPDCKVSPLWYAPPSREISATDLGVIKRGVAREVLRHRVLLSYRPTVLLQLLNRPVISAANATPAAATDADDPRIRTALTAFDLAHRMGGDAIFILNPVLWDQRSPTLPAELVSRSRSHGFEVVRVDEYMPVQRGEQEWSRWYIPGDGHWSDYGAKIYGRAVHRAIRNRILNSRGIETIADSTSCAAAFDHFRAGEAAVVRRDKELAFESFNAALTMLPVGAAERFRTTTEFRECGFIPDLYVEHSLLLEERGQGTAAAAEWTRAVDLSADPTEYYRRRLKERKERADQSGIIADLTELIGLHPKDIALVFDRAQADSAIGDQKAVIADADRMLLLDPRNRAAFFMRCNARVALGQLDEALEDIDAALQLSPDHAPFHQTQAVILDLLKLHQKAAAESKESRQN
jgi:tetratricopeptide (TPR) repeat protein